MACREVCIIDFEHMAKYMCRWHRDGGCTEDSGGTRVCRSDSCAVVKMVQTQLACPPTEKVTLLKTAPSCPECGSIMVPFAAVECKQCGYVHAV